MLRKQPPTIRFTLIHIAARDCSQEEPVCDDRGDPIKRKSQVIVSSSERSSSDPRRGTDRALSEIFGGARARALKSSSEWCPAGTLQQSLISGDDRDLPKGHPATYPLDRNYQEFRIDIAWRRRLLESA
jgi:hypothetical protein